MRMLMMAGVSALALGVSPAMAQNVSSGNGKAGSAGEFPCPHYDMESSGLRSADVKEAMRRDASGASDRGAWRTGDATTDEGPARDAVGDGTSGWSARSDAQRDDRGERFEELAEELPVPDVSDRDVETRAEYREDEDGPLDAEPRRSDRSDRSATTSGTDGSERSARSSTSEDDELSGIIEEGDVVPEGIRDWQDRERWDLGAQGDQKSAERLRDRDGSGSGTGSDETSRSTGMNDGKEQAQSSDSGEDATGGDIEDRRRALAQVARLIAQQAVPSARFSSYRFTIDDNERVIEISGRDRATGERVSVDVYADGRVQSIDSAIPLDAVPESVRRAVRSELGRFRVAHTTRSLRRDLDIYYEFAGFSESGRPLAVEIRSDGRDMSVRYLNRS
jgi:hypothetical protein